MANTPYAHNNRHSWSGHGLKALKFGYLDTASEPASLSEEQLSTVKEDSRTQLGPESRTRTESSEIEEEDEPTEDDFLEAWNRKNVLSLGEYLLSACTNMACC
jgi:hypothetical protein